MTGPRRTADEATATPRAATLPGDDRAQSLNDFVIGVALFLLVLGYTFAFLPAVFDPFVGEGSGSTQQADRTADLLAADLLAENESAAGPSAAAVPGLLNGTCTTAFFDNTTERGCRFGSGDLGSVVALPETARVNVTVTRDGEIVELSDGEIVESGDVSLARGPDPTNATDAARAVRIVTLDGRDVRLTARVW